MKPNIIRNAFQDKGEAIRQIAELGLWPVTISKGKEPLERPHFHDISAWFYVIEGGLLVKLGEDLEEHALSAGDYAFIPAGCLHAVEVPQGVVVVNGFDRPNWREGVQQKFPDKSAGIALSDPQTRSGHSIVEM